MTLSISCYMCGKELDAPGGLLFSPPGAVEEGLDTFVLKIHLCSSCFTDVCGYIESQRLKKET